MKGYWIVILSLLPLYSTAQIITTFAGTGAAGFIGDGGPATAAGLPNPGGGTFDRYGNYYFADAQSCQRIRKIDTAGIITTVAGNGGPGAFSSDNVPATASRLNQPQAVKVDTFGNLYIADDGNNRIRKVDITTGIISTLAGNGIGAFGGDGFPATAASLYAPQDMCFDKFGNLYVADAFNYRVRKINTSGIITTFAGNGTLGSSGDGFPATAGQLDLPMGLAADTAGNIYIADNGGLANCVRKVNTAGIITTVAGNGTATYIGDGIPATNAQIAPIKIAVDTVGNLFIADKYNNRCYKVDVSGILHNIAGTGVAGDTGDGTSATTATLNYPTGVALDACGNLYIPTIGSMSISGSGRRIRKLVFNPTCDPHIHGSNSLKINTLTNNTIFIYPNPTSSSFIAFDTHNITQIAIIDLTGRMLSSCDFYSEEEKREINISDFSSGIYIIRITDEDGQKKVTKIIKQ